MQACGVSLRAAAAARSALISVLRLGRHLLRAASSRCPTPTRRFREITFNVAAERAEGEVKPRVVLRRTSPTSCSTCARFRRRRRLERRLHGRPPRRRSSPAIYLARHGRVRHRPRSAAVEMVLEDGIASHGRRRRASTTSSTSSSSLLSVDPAAMFRAERPPKGAREMSIAELRRADRRTRDARRASLPHNERMEIHQKFSIPVACLVFGLIGLALGATQPPRRHARQLRHRHRRHLRLLRPAVARPVAGQGTATFRRGSAAWLPNIVLGALGDPAVRLARPRWPISRSGIPVPRWVQRACAATARPCRSGPGASSTATSRAPMCASCCSAARRAARHLLHLHVPRSVGQGVQGHGATLDMLANYFCYTTPQYVYYILPLSVLLATLVTIGLLTKNSELVVMKACGISLYRVALPMLASALIAGGGALRARGDDARAVQPPGRSDPRTSSAAASPQTFDVLHRRWVVGSERRDLPLRLLRPARAAAHRPVDLRVHTTAWSASRGGPSSRARRWPSGQGPRNVWQLERGWTREFDAHGEASAVHAVRRGEPTCSSRPDVLRHRSSPNPDFMSYTQLRDYTERLRGERLRRDGTAGRALAKSSPSRS